jgi:hypothetical protein
MSNEEENDFGFTQFLSKLRSLSRNKKILVVLSICLVASLVSYAAATALAPIWSDWGGPMQSNPQPTASPTASPIPTPTPEGSLSAVIWTDAAIAQSDSPSPVTVGDQLTLSSTLTGTLTGPQTVTFYYTTNGAIQKGGPIGTDPSISLVVIGTGTATNGQTASCSWTVQAANVQYWFIAEIIAPS